MPAYHPRDDVPIFQTKHDRLNRARLADRLMEAICLGPLPQVMGVEGDWGSGKTSLLQNLFWRIEKKVVRSHAHNEDEEEGDTSDETNLPDASNVRAIWFEAWRYQHEPDPIIALLHEIRSQLMSGKKWNQFVKKLGKKGKAVASMTIHGLTTWFSELISSVKLEAAGKINSGIFTSQLIDGGISGKIIANVPDVAKHAQAASITYQAEEARKQAERLEQPLRCEQIRAQLHAAISLFLGQELLNKDSKSSRRLVIIIDDLDRCDAEAVCRLLESIKIHLDLPSCFFVLGLNRRHVETSLTTRLIDAFHSSDDTVKEHLLRARASDYVEKICTNLIRIPRPDSECCLQLASECLKELVWPVSFKESSGKSLLTIIDLVLKGKHFVPLPSNPRRIKALCNQFQLAILNSEKILKKWDESILDQHNEDNEIEFLRICISKIFIFAALRQFFSDLYRMLEVAPRLYSNLYQWCSSPAESLATQEAEAAHLLRRLNPIARSISTEPRTMGLMDLPTLLPDPHEGIAFFIQELIVISGNITEDEVIALTCMV